MALPTQAIDPHRFIAMTAANLSEARHLRSMIAFDQTNADRRRRLKDKTISLIQFDKGLSHDLTRWHHRPFPMETLGSTWLPNFKLPRPSAMGI